MQFNKKVLFALMLLILTVGAVCASDTNQTTQIEELDDGSTISSNSKSYAGLESDISNSSGILDVEDDYAFDFETDFDYLSGILIDKDLTIYGNNHTINGKNVAAVFHIQNVNQLEINDLIIQDCVGYVMNLENSNVVLNNVQFIANADPTNVISNEIYSSHSNISVNNSLFTGKIYGESSAIYALENSSITIEDSRFIDLNSIYGGAVTIFDSSLSVKNSTFENVHANLTGGAIAIKFLEDHENNIFIENCEFDNVTSAKNGGAIYYDSRGISFFETVLRTMIVLNSTFKDCGSDFGGAILQLNGNLTLSDSTFINNYAKTYGGAIYTSLTNLNINDSKFIENSAGTQAGALYFDNAKLTISNSNFTKNKVNLSGKNIAGAIYIYDGDVNIGHSIFDNNGTSIYGVYTKRAIFSNNTYDVVMLNNTEEVIAISNKGITLNLTNNSIDCDNLPVKFDLRDWGWVTPVQNQGNMGACWAFGNIAAMESSLLKATGIEFDLSESNVQHNGLKYSIYGDTRNNEGGYDTNALGYVLSWRGVIPEVEDVYDEFGKVSIIQDSDNRIHVQDAILIIPAEINQTVKQMKEAIIKYGALTIGYDANHTEPNYNETNYAFYTNETASMGHTVSVVGWDDTFSKDNFINTPPGDGVWIVKNSWGTEWGDKGYFYMSYYDKSFEVMNFDDLSNFIIGYIFENTISYTTNYQTDLTGLSNFDGNYTYYSNEFTSKYDELIGAVGTFFNESGIDYSFDIYVNGAKVHTQSGVSEFAGFRTIVLNKYIPIKTDDKFKVVFKNNALPYQILSRQHYVQGMSFASADGSSWTDLEPFNTTVCLKAYTVADDTKIINNKDISVDYNGGKYFSVKVVTDDGRAVGAGLSVKFNINGKTTTVKTGSNGIAKIKITDVPKKYTITTTYKGKSIKNTVTVKQVLTASKVTVKKTAKKFTLKAKLKINGKLVKGKKITFKFNGKTYKVKTNSKGIAQKTLKKSVIKKLKKGKTYNVKVTYCKDTIKTTVKVK